MGQTNDDFFGKLNARLSFEILDRNEEDVVNVIVLLTHDCKYEIIAKELELVGLQVNVGWPIITGSIAIKNLKALAALSYVLQIDGSQRLFTC